MRINILFPSDLPDGVFQVRAVNDRTRSNSGDDKARNCNEQLQANARDFDAHYSNQPTQYAYE
jgi:hypothetical protein